MGLHTTTAEVLEDRRLCNNVCRALDMDLSRRYIQNRYGVSKRQVDHIKRIYYFNDNNTERIYYVGEIERNERTKEEKKARMA